MNKDNKIINNIVFYVKYPYTALTIATMWISLAFIISLQNQVKFEPLIITASIATLIIAYTGFKPTK